MKSRLTVLTLMLSFIVFACNEKQSIEPTKEEKIHKVFELKRQKIKYNISIPVELSSLEQAKIRAKIPGYIKLLKVDIGDFIKKGQLLVVVDAPEMNAKLLEAKAHEKEAKSHYLIKKEEYERFKNVSSLEGAVSQIQLITAKNMMLSSKELYLAALASTRLYREMEQYLEIRAPFDGVVTSRELNVGDFVGGNKQDVILTIDNPFVLRLHFNMPELYVKDTPSTDSITFSTESIRRKQFKAPFSRKSNIISAQSRTEKWEYRFKNDSLQLLPGMYAKGELNMFKGYKGFMVPMSAVVTTMKEQFVVAVVDKRTKWIDVKMGVVNNDSVEIFGELSDKDILLVRGSEEIPAGSEIQYAR
ncbi:efflux RND transporter periplasmic adaptor subunit [Halosquirtibacter xylanolyticus]|uniref:efflux RND transporter periplasmic adaptor subunit n=1 Tax=Halosquirtibacter xylanolyticus TaxID=3374599 RepID=UPI00374A1D24|nr:efflux RND transporter periplasmic adaptor subunit [Prolixibacteraceae bacterium]